MSHYRIGDVYMPRLHVKHGLYIVNRIRCGGGLNTTNPPVFDPTSNILYVSHGPGCSGGYVMPGLEAAMPDLVATTGTTISEWVVGPGGGHVDVRRRRTGDPARRGRSPLHDGVRRADSPSARQAERGARG